MTKSDARGVTTTNSYDALNRVLTTSYSDGTPARTYSYDQVGSNLIGLITNGKGRQTSAWTSDGIGYSWSYDSMGRVLQQIFQIDGTNYPVSYNYTATGCGCAQKDLVSMTYPNGLQVNYTRDSIGRVTAIGDSNYQTYVSNVAYNSPSGGLSSTNIDSFSYDYTGRLISSWGTDLWNTYTWTYQYSSAGRAAQVTKSGGSVYYNDVTTSDFSYDNLGRLSSVTTNDSNYGLYSTTYAYDRYNNLLTNGSSGLSVNQATNRLTNLTYDPAGNVLSNGFQTYTYNGMGMLAQVNSGQVAAFRYDAFGRRVKKTFDDSTIGGSPLPLGYDIYVLGIDGQILADYGHMNDNIGDFVDSVTNNLIFGSKIIGTSTTQTGISFYQILPSYTKTMIPLAFSMNSRYDQPFASMEQFPGEIADIETRWTNFSARNYDNYRYYRWMSADSIMAHTYDPQSLNKYTYVRNDPVNRVDPNGKQDIYIDGGTIVVTAPPDELAEYGFMDDLDLEMFLRYAAMSTGVGMSGNAQAIQAALSVNINGPDQYLEYIAGQGQLNQTLDNFRSQPLSSGCDKFMQGIFAYATANKIGNYADYGNVKAIIGLIQNANFNLELWNTGATVTLNGQTMGAWSLLDPSQQHYANAFYVPGSNNIYIGIGAFDHLASTILHEAMHIGYWDDTTQKFVGLGMDDIEVAKAAGVYTPGMTGEQASAAFGGAIASNCP